jgi:hypothetical protein
MKKHRSPAPLHVEAMPHHNGQRVDYHIENAQGYVLAHISGVLSYRHRHAGNAAMFAASPDLLAALETITAHAQEAYPHFESERGQRDIAAALAAIQKATE